ncbi:MAG: histidine kinase [Verrucomicrobiota bacterium]
MLLIAACASGLAVEEVQAQQDHNPVARIARLFNPQLVEVEDRMGVLAREISSLAQLSKHSLTAGLGYRGCRSHAGAADPSITMDLGAPVPIEAVFLVPAQTELVEDSEVFPRRYTLELSNQADFQRCTRLYQSGAIPQRAPDGIPVSFQASETARYVRLTVQEGFNKGSLDLFGLSEFVVISHGEPVSFGAAVSTVGALNTPGIWYPEALTDGRMPLGIWQHGSHPKLDPGEVVTLANPGEATTWTLQLDATAPLDRIILFPYQAAASCNVSIFPESLVVSLDPQDGQPATEVTWTAPRAGESHLTPLVIPLHGQAAKTLRLTASRPFILGARQLHALSEIEVWSHGTNLAADRPVRREHAGQAVTLGSLTDGYSSEGKIIPVAIWLHQLHERDRLERELAPLRSAQRQLASNSELNTIWGCSMALGLTFLIPVFLIERRRLMTKDQLDQMRKRISADLHDDVGSNLGSISLIARTARKDLLRLDGPPQIATDLSEMETIARESSLAMRDIVWLLERKQDSIGDLVQRMRETAGRLLREIQFTLECESHKGATKLSLDAKRHLFLFYKESIHNILKHSQATRVSIRLWDERNQLALEIIDNGVGIPMDAAARPAALSKLEERARLLGGLLQITSSKETGTRIQLLVTRSHLTSSNTFS